MRDVPVPPMLGGWAHWRRIIGNGRWAFHRTRTPARRQVKDARRPDALSTSYQERLAFAVASTVLSVEVEQYDRDGRQGTVDAILHYAAGRRRWRSRPLARMMRHPSSTTSHSVDTLRASPG